MFREFFNFNFCCFVIFCLRCACVCLCLCVSLCAFSMCILLPLSEPTRLLVAELFVAV